MDWYICLTWMVDFYGFRVGKTTSPMDPLGIFHRFTDIATWNMRTFLTFFYRKDHGYICIFVHIQRRLLEGFHDVNA